jgi:hypothetical protein
MKHFKDWTIKDKHPDKKLEEIGGSDKFFSLWSRIHKNIKEEIDCAVNIVGVLDTIEALDYHFENYIKLKDSKNNNYQKHELSAYLNRIGQLYYFVISDFVKKYVPEPLQIMTKVEELKIFRMKNTAHRSIDAPKNESPEMRRRQAISLLGFTCLIIDDNKKQYLLPSDSGNGATVWNYFTPEIDHIIIFKQTYDLMEQLIKNITKH